MKKIMVWDLYVRLFHWSLVIAFLLSSFSAFQDKVMTGYDVMHLNAGLTILVLATSRFIWGFVGSTTALFTSFLRGPRSIVRHLRSISVKGSVSYTYVGHNPLGGWFVIIILIALIVQAMMGLYSNDSILFEGPLAASLDENLSNQITDYHKILGIIIIALAILHVASVLLYSIGKGIELIKPMVFGYKVVSDTLTEDQSQEQTLRFVSPLWALTLFLITGYVWCWFIF
jgi:cytochrome b